MPEAKEAIAYNIPAYKIDGRAVLFLAAWKEPISIYMGRHAYEVGRPARGHHESVQAATPVRRFAHDAMPGVTLHRDSPVDLVQRLKAEDGKDIWLCGGSKLASALIDEIDELILKINPVLFGAGISLFDAPSGPFPLTLASRKEYANGFVLARYVKAGS